MSITITKNDLEIFHELVVAEYHTLDTLNAPLRRGREGLRSRLYQLQKGGYLQATSWNDHIRHGKIGSPNVYFLGPKSLPHLDLDPETAVRVANRVRNGDDITGANLRHSALRSQFRAALLSRDDLALTDWIQSRRLKFEWDIYGERGAIMPDTFFRLEQDGKRFNFFLEVDRVTYAVRRSDPDQGSDIVTKLRRYDILLDSPEKVAMMGKLGIGLFRLIFLKPKCDSKNPVLHRQRFDTIRTAIAEENLPRVAKVVRFVDEEWLRYGELITLENSAGEQVTLFD